MNLPAPTLLLGAFSGAAILVLVLHDLDRASPGPLAHVHQRVPELADSDGCAQCHGGWFESMTDSCLECHEPIAKHIEAGAGLHGILDPELAGNCAVCHSDHHGEGFAIVDVQSFRNAGFEGRDDFQHARVGFPMDGKHLELSCAECHTNADERLLPEGEHRYLGLSQDCATCHDDPHEGQMQMACADCHTQDSFAVFAPEDHDRFLALSGVHAIDDCRTCHAEGDAHSLEALGSAGHGGARKCADCHESPHASPFLHAFARAESVDSGASCAECHDPQAVATFTMAEPSITVRAHGFSGFALTEPHNGLSCAECHDPALATFEERHPGRLADDCAACHADVHEGQFDDGPFGGQGCLHCHERTHFSPSAFGVEEHAQTRFALEHSHAALDCADCHAESSGEVRRFAATPGACEDCHLDAHRGHFQEQLAAREVQANSCAECHLPTKFRDVDTAAFDHEGWTGVGLNGAHAHAACEACHERSDAPDERGRRFGCVSELFGELVGCETCHEDPHEGAFDAQSGVPEVHRGETGCARCHVESSFRAQNTEFDHQLWTGFPLHGRHFELECSACHAPVVDAQPGGRTWERALGRDCSDCHSNPHAGQFRRGGETDCSRCHQSPTSWSRLAFDHDRDSRFPLEDAHRTLDCGACHTRWDDGGEGIVRYRPLGMECADCHGHASGGNR